MGRLSATAIADELGVNETTLSWHFNHNCYPPIPALMIDPALEAIAAFNDEDEGTLVALPDGVTYRGESAVPAWMLIESLHLEAFIGVTP